MSGELLFCVRSLLVISFLHRWIARLYTLLFAPWLTRNCARTRLLMGLIRKFRSKIEILVKNWNFGQKSKFGSKIKILVKNRNLGQKLKFWSKIEILVKNRNLGQKSKFWSKIEILVKNRNFGQKSKFWSTIKFSMSGGKVLKNKIQIMIKMEENWIFHK